MSDCSRLMSSGAAVVVVGVIEFWCFCHGSGYD